MPKYKEGDPFPVVLWPGFRIISVFMRDSDDDPDQEYDYESFFVMTPETDMLGAAKGKFKFREMLHRFTVTVPIPLQFKDSGIMYAHCRIKKVGHAEGQWVSQDYPVLIDVLNEASQEPTTQSPRISAS
jgi:hypothetical protein